MRDLSAPAVDRYRRRDAAVLRVYGGFGDANCGVFGFPSPIAGRSLLVIVSSGGGWEHASVSLLPEGRRCPVWEEMDSVKRRLWRDDEAAMQLHVATADHLSYHPTTLHLWRPVDRPVPLPPKWMVAPYPGWRQDAERDAKARGPLPASEGSP